MSDKSFREQVIHLHLLKIEELEKFSRKIEDFSEESGIDISMDASYMLAKSQAKLLRELVKEIAKIK